MSVDRLPGAQSAALGPIQQGRDRDGLGQLSPAELAREFESMLILQMLRQMRQATLDDPESEGGLSSSTMFDVVDSELARQLSRDGGLGLAEVMMKALQRQLPVESGSQMPEKASVAGVTPAAPSAWSAPARAVPTGEGSPVAVRDGVGLPDARTTSAFGWRNDPFTGKPRYHYGMDIRAAYGQGVPAAADGVIVEAQDRGAYGLTVLIEHPNGVRTRYAHLAAMDVRVGDRVLQGQEIGRVGQTGRATGPHLHFEVIRDGQRIDPQSVVALRGTGLDGLKLVGTVADFQSGGHVYSPAMTGADDED